MGLRLFLAIVGGVVLGQVASRVTQYYTSSQFKPVKDIAESGTTGPATVVLSGISSGLESAVWAVLAVGRDLGTLGEGRHGVGADVQPALLHDPDLSRDARVRVEPRTVGQTDDRELRVLLRQLSSATMPPSGSGANTPGRSSGSAPSGSSATRRLHPCAGCRRRRSRAPQPGPPGHRPSRPAPSTTSQKNLRRLSITVTHG